MSVASRPGGEGAAVVTALAIGAAFSFYQLGSGVFACGKQGAGPEIHLWMTLAGAQAVAFLLAARSPRWQLAYRLLQYLTLPLVAVPLLQLAATYPRTFGALAVAALAYRLGARGAAAVKVVVFLLAMLVIHSSIAFLVLNTRGLALGNGLFLAILAAAAVAAALIGRRDAPAPLASIAQVPPLALLAVVVLRAKLPDQAYDSLFYKATLPIMIADWRTAVTGLLDHSALLGTNLQEFINAQLRIADPSYSPALVSTLAFLGLWIVAPAASASLMRASGSFARNVLALLLVSLTESLVAAGTAYQEPLMGLLMVAALLPIPAAWLFLGAAVAVKVTAGFVAPVIVIARWWSMEPASSGTGGGVRAFAARMLERTRPRAVALVACLVLAALTAGEQFYRNIAYTGRLTGITETLVDLTDPQDRVLAADAGNPLVALQPRGAWQKYGRTFVHVLTLDRWIVPGELDFHILPSSRLPAVAAMLALVVLAFPALRRDRTLVVGFAVWIACAFVLLNFVWQGRYLYVLSLAAALPIAYLAGRVQAQAGGAIAMLLAVAAALLAFGDQLVGSYVNDGWLCRRNLVTGVVPNDYDRPATALERRLAALVTRYRDGSPWRDVVPTILCENSVDRLRYVGTHYVYTYISLRINNRRLAARPDLAASLPTALLALCSTDPAFPGQILTPEARAQFEAVDPVRTEGGFPVYILVSKPLMAGARPSTLSGGRMDPLGWLAGPLSAAR
jgi:hypothetical protein